jgi:hypothetical protein
MVKSLRPVVLVECLRFIFNVFTLYTHVNLATPDCVIKTYQEEALY